MGEGRAGRLRERRDARDARDARRGRGGSRARSGAGDAGGARIVARRAALGTTPPRGGSAARRGAAGTDRARVGAGGRAHMAVRDDERVVGGARGVPRPGGDGRGAARGGSDRRAAARERAPRGAQRERQRRRGRGGHRRARARRTCAFARGKPRVVLVRAMHRDAAGSAEKDERGDRRTNRQKLRMLGKSCFSSVGTPPRFGHQTVARKETPGASAFPRGKNPPIASSWQIRLPPSWRTRRRGPRATRGAHIRPRRARDSASAADTAPPPRTPRRAFATARRPRVTHGTLALAAPTPRFPSSDAPRIAHPRRIRAEK